MRRGSLPILDTLQVATPCVADWELMVGDDRKRFCKACEKFVYNLPLLEADELVDLIKSTEGKFCGRLYARKDGTVLTDDCPVGVAAKLAAARRRRATGATAAVAALMIAAGGTLFGLAYGGVGVSPMVAGGIQAPPPPPVVIEDQPEVVVQPEQPEPPEMIMGKMMPAPKDVD